MEIVKVFEFPSGSESVGEKMIFRSNDNINNSSDDYIGYPIDAITQFRPMH